MKRKKKRAPAKRNPIARAVKKIRPQAVPDKRRRKLARIKKQEAREEMESD